MQLPNQSRDQLMSRSGLILALYGGLSLVALLIAAARDDLDIYRIGEDSGSHLAIGPLVGLAIGVLLVLLSRLAVHRFDWARRLHNDFRSILGKLSFREILVLALASSIGEELLFRGALMPFLGLWLQALVFALLHIGPGTRFLPWTAQAFAVGLLFGWLAQVTGDLGAPIVAHFVVNFLNLKYIARVDLAEPASSSRAADKAQQKPA